MNFHRKFKNVQNRKILYTQKFDAVRYISWPKLIEKLHIILTKQKHVEKSETLILTVYLSVRFYLLFHPL